MANQIKIGSKVRLWIPYEEGLGNDDGEWMVAKVTAINGNDPSEGNLAGVFTDKGWGRSAKMLTSYPVCLQQHFLEEY